MIYFSVVVAMTTGPVVVCVSDIMAKTTGPVVVFLLVVMAKTTGPSSGLSFSYHDQDRRT